MQDNKYKVIIDKKIKKKLAKLSQDVEKNLFRAMYDLADNPRPQGYKKLKNKPGYRIRKGNYRIVYDIYDHIITITVIAVGHRRDVYV